MVAALSPVRWLTATIDPKIKTVLDKVMPGAVWTDWVGRYGAGLERKTYGVAVKIAEFLRGSVTMPSRSARGS